jgi:hypothetical protein
VIPLRSKAKVAAPTKPESEGVPAGIEGIVETLADLQKEVLISALKASTRKKGTNMPDRTLTTAAALKKVTALDGIKERLKDQNTVEEATKPVAAIRALVKIEELQKFDDELDDWVNAQP